MNAMMILDQHPDKAPYYANLNRRFIGFWRNTEHPNLPDPIDFVDEDWDDKEQALVADLLADARVATQYRGYHMCRICGMRTGSGDLDDNFFIWPQGFSHYVRAHAVRPPQEFIDHLKTARSKRKVVKLETEEVRAQLSMEYWRKVDMVVRLSLGVDRSFLDEIVAAASVVDRTALRWAYAVIDLQNTEGPLPLSRDAPPAPLQSPQLQFSTGGELELVPRTENPQLLICKTCSAAPGISKPSVGSEWLFFHYCPPRRCVLTRPPLPAEQHFAELLRLQAYAEMIGPSPKE